MPIHPKLSDIQTERIKFNPGDRVIIRTVDDLALSQKISLKRSIQKFAGVDLRILIVNCFNARIRKITPDDEELLCGREHAQMPSNLPGTANISLKRIDFNSGDKLFVFFLNGHLAYHGQKKQALDYLKRWAGDGVEIIIKWSGD